MRFGDHMQKTPLLVIREMPGGQLAQLFHAIALERLAEGMEAQPMQCVRAGGAAGIVLGPDVARLSAVVRLCAIKNTQPPVRECCSPKAARS